MIEREWRENHILAKIFSKNRVGVQKCQILSAPPISGNVINQILYLETPGNNSRHVDKCCTAGLGTLFVMYFPISHSNEHRLHIASILKGAD